MAEVCISFGTSPKLAGLHSEFHALSVYHASVDVVAL